MNYKKNDKLKCMEHLNSTVIDDHLRDPSRLMEEIVRSVLKNDKKAVTTLVNIVLNQVDELD